MVQLSPTVRDALFAGAFPVYSYLYTLREQRWITFGERQREQSEWRNCGFHEDLHLVVCFRNGFCGRCYEFTNF